MPTNTQRIVALEDEVSRLTLAVQVLTSPLNKIAEAPADGAPKPLKAQRDGLQRPTCVNFRKCGNKSDGVPLTEAIGWKCASCSS